MNKIAAGFAGIVLAVSFSACSAADSSEPTATETVTVAPEISGQALDDAFLFLLRDNTTSFSHVPDHMVLELADGLCEAWDVGATLEEITIATLSSGYSAEDGGFFVGAATEAFCPEHSHVFENSSSL